MYIIWLYKNTLRRKHIETVFHKYNSNRCVTLGHFEIDLTIIIRSNNSNDYERCVINIHHDFTHTCPTCSFGTKKRQIGKRYKANKSFDELRLESNKNDQKIKEMIRKLPYSNYKIFYSCCQLKNKIRKYKTINNFLKNCPDSNINNVYKHIISPPKSISLNNIKNFFHNFDENMDSVNNNLKWFYYNALYICKLNTPEEYRNSQFGYIVSKACITCELKHLLNEESEETHICKTVAAHNSFSYTIVTGKMLSFLCRSKNVEIIDITHVLTYMPNSNYKEFFKRSLEIRENAISHELQYLSKFVKTILSSIIGCFGMRPNNENNSCSIKLCRYIPRSTPLNKIIRFQSAGRIFNEQYFYITLKSNPPSLQSLYFRQGHLLQSIIVLLASKTSLLNVFHMFEQYFDPSKYHFVMCHTDSIMMASTSSESIFDAVLPNKKKYFDDNVKNKYFVTSSNTYPYGKLKLESSVNTEQNKSFRFIAPMSLSYCLDVINNSTSSTKSSKETPESVLKGISSGVTPQEYVNGFLKDNSFKHLRLHTNQLTGSTSLTTFLKRNNSYSKTNDYKI